MKEGRNTYPCQSVMTPTYPSECKVSNFLRNLQEIAVFFYKYPNHARKRGRVKDLRGEDEIKNVTLRGEEASVIQLHTEHGTKINERYE